MSTARIFDMPERVIKFPFSQNATQISTGITLGSGLVVTDVFVNVTAAAAGTLNVGLGSTAVDNVIDALSCASTGYKYRDVIESEFLPSQYGAAGGNFVNTAAGLAVGGTVQKVKTANAIEYTIDGIRYSKAATDDLFTFSGWDCAASKAKGAFLYLDTAGAASIVGTADAASVSAIVWPDPVVAGKCCIGYVTVLQSGGGGFTGATTGFDDATTTDAYTDAVSGTNSSTFGLTDQLVPAMGGVRLASDSEIFYTTSAHAIAGWVYIVVKGGFE
jgi:hypothetical protein